MQDARRVKALFRRCVAAHNWPVGVGDGVVVGVGDGIRVAVGVAVGVGVGGVPVGIAVGLATGVAVGSTTGVAPILTPPPNALPATLRPSGLPKVLRGNSAKRTGA